MILYAKKINTFFENNLTNKPNKKGYKKNEPYTRKSTTYFK